MSRLALTLRAASSLVRRDWVVFKSYRSNSVSRVVNAVASVTLFYFISRLIGIRGAGPDAYFAFVVVGMVIMQTLNATLASAPADVRSELMTGQFERILVSPFGPLAGLLSMMVFPTLLALGTGVAMVLSGIVLFGMPVAGATIALAIPMAVLISIAFLPFAIMLASAVLAFNRVPPGAGYVVTGLALISGLYFPTELLPDGVRWLSAVQPFSPAVELLRHLISGASTSQAPLILVARLLAFALVLGPISFVVLQRALDIGRRRGSLCEY